VVDDKPEVSIDPAEIQGIEFHGVLEAEERADDV